MKKIKILFNDLKFYFKVLKDFSELNRYVFFSSKCLNRLERLLYSNLGSEVILDNIKIIYNDFKIDYEKDDLVEGVNIKNGFQ